MTSTIDLSREVPERIDAEVDVAVIGAGAAGIVCALRAADGGAEVAVFERDPSPAGSTSMSSGFIPAAGTRFQRAANIADDSAGLFEADIQAKSHGRSDPRLARLATRSIAAALEWLDDEAGLEWIVLDDFLYPGHSRHRMHAVPERTGEALMSRLLAAARSRDIPILTSARATRLYIGADRRIRAVGIERPDGGNEIVGCNALVLACNGYGGNRELVGRYIPSMSQALYYGHAGNTGDAVVWGEQLGARLEHLSGCQGHGSLAHPHAILITWALMTRGGIQVNAQGLRFSDESGGYSEQAVHVLSQPDAIAWNVYDAGIHEFGLSFPDYREAVDAGAVLEAADVGELAARIGVPAGNLRRTLEAIDAARRGGQDDFGRDFTQLPPLKAPFHAVRVTGALFHTQGGLLVDDSTRVVDRNGAVFPNLFAVGGAACGVSGPDVSGYLSGNGLLTAVAFGFVAGMEAAGRSGSAQANTNTDLTGGSR